LFGAAAGSAVAAAAVPALTPAAPGRAEDPGFFGEVTARIDDSSLRLRLHDTGEEILVRARPGAEVGRDGASRVSDFEPGERVTAIGSRAGDVVSASAVYSVADLYEVTVTARHGQRLETPEGTLLLDGETQSAVHIGGHADARTVHPDSVAPGMRLWALSRRDPSSNAAAIRRFAVLP
jgi:hypothetical protein